MPSAPDSAARGFIYSSVVWLVVGASALALAGVKLLLPEFLTSGFLSFGRLRAVASVALIYGWLTQGALGAAFYCVPRMTGVRIRSERGGGVAGILGSSAVLLTLVVIFFDGIAGQEFLELSRWAAALLILSLAIAAAVILATIAGRIEPEFHPSLWYFAGAVIWAPLSLAAGTLPAFSGARDSIAGLFSISSYLHSWVGMAAMGSLLYVIPRAAAAPLWSHRLALISFWWFAFTAPLTAQGRHMFGPAPDWLETVAVSASIAVLVSVLGLVINLLGTLRGTWGRMPDYPSIRFAFGGLVVWAAAMVLGTVISFRSVAEVFGLTEAVTGQLWLVVAGLSLWITAVITYAFPRLMGRRWFSRTSITAHFWVTVFASVFIVMGTWGSGISTGIVARTGVMAERPLSAGHPFEVVLQFAGKFRALTVAGLLLFATASWIFARNLFHTTVAGEVRTVEVVAPPEISEFGESPAGVEARLAVPLLALIFGISASIGYFAPLADASLGAEGEYTLTYSEETTTGKSVYESEGCWYCHTQSVRPVLADLGLGKATTPERIAGDRPTVLGLARIGPDLACVGDRFEGSDPLVDYLRNPKTLRPHSKMPPLTYLSDEEVGALAAYLSSLRCA